jgi:glycosyltransferase involved in cell wall biosynthesis
VKSKLRICVNTQTPLVRFKTTYSELRERYGYSDNPIHLEELNEGADYEFTPGGVTGMVHSALKRMMSSGLIRPDPRWISLGPGAPSEILFDNIRLYNVSLSEDKLVLYANFKEGIWNEIHGLATLSFKPREYEAYVEYNWNCAKLMLDMLQDVDLFWIHDFQQLHIGNLLGPSAPAVFRWHIPFRLEGTSQKLRTFVLKNIASFDSIIVSTKRDLEGLIRAGYGGQVHAIYPYLDPDEWKPTSPKMVDEVAAKFGLLKDEKVLLVVARMDPVKNQDTAIKALSLVRKKYPHTKLVLAGNGSFTGSAKGGLGHPKAARWSTYLRTMVNTLKLQDSVVFTGHVSHEDLNALYTIAEAVLVPSKIEGFNLTAVEGWLRKKPCIVSSGAGVSELVNDGANGFRFTGGNEDDLAKKMSLILRSQEDTAKMGENGLMTSKMCSIDAGVAGLRESFESVLKLY